MKPLILSFFLVILGISLLTNKKERPSDQPVKENEQRSVYYEVMPNSHQSVDSLYLIKDKIAVLN